MGCGSSTPAVGPSDAELRRPRFAETGHGSVILGASDEEDGASGDADGVGVGAFLATKGGSYVIGRKDAGAWELGDEIVRPPNSVTAARYFVLLPGGRALRVSHAAVSEQGRNARPPHKPNQDSFLCLPRLGNERDVLLFGVFDGHGPHGEDAANFCRVNLPDVVLRQPEFPASPLDAVARSVERLHRRLVAPARPGQPPPAVDTSVSGCVAILLALRGAEWLVANVGDSRAIMGSVGGVGGGDLLVRPLSSDHKPSRDDERARIARSPARILSEAALGIEGGATDKYYICRVANGTIRYGVLFTRSIGDADAHTHLGLSCAPECRSGTLTPADRFIVLASDGVWDVMDEAAVARCVDDAGDDAHAAAAAIVDAARALWDGGGERRRDDITAVVLMFDFVDAADPAVAAALAAQEADAVAVAAGGATPVASVVGGGATALPISSAAAASAGGRGEKGGGGAASLRATARVGSDRPLGAADDAVVVAADATAGPPPGVATADTTAPPPPAEVTSPRDDEPRGPVVE